MISKQLLDLVVCPENRSPLVEADDTLLAGVNQAVAAGRLKNRAGATIEQPLAGGLVRLDRAVLYPIVDGIPILLFDEGIPLDQLSAAG